MNSPSAMPPARLPSALPQPHNLLDSLLNHHQLDGDASHLGWLARAIAAASFGGHHLRPPDCGDCEPFRSCFGPATDGEIDGEIDGESDDGGQ